MSFTYHMAMVAGWSEARPGRKDRLDWMEPVRASGLASIATGLARLGLREFQMRAIGRGLLWARYLSLVMPTSEGF